MRVRDVAALQFDAVRQRLADYARSPAGKDACRALSPTSDRTSATQALDRTWHCFRLVEQFGPLPVGEFPDIRAAVRTAAREGAVLDGKSLVEIRTALEAVRVVRVYLQQCAASLGPLADLPERLVALPPLQLALTRALDDTGAVTDDASDELADLRRTMRQLRDQLTRRLDDLLARTTMTEVIADRYVTIRNNRFVLPIKTAAAAQFSGVVQDRSVSGETTFIEPLFAVELNNRLLLAAREEEALVRRILADLTALVHGEQDVLLSTFAALVEIDTLAARAAFAQRYRCTQPQFDDAEIALRQARHPLLLFSERAVVPIDMLLPRGKRILVITGPNTGGKTVALKTVGLLALMAQSGMLIPAAEGSRLPCFAAIHADVGDDQSIERNLSTFSAHLANVADILSSSASPALVLLDEPGVGTDPEEGAALGIGMIRALEARPAFVVVSTHYVPIKIFALTHDSCLAAAVDFNLETMTPSYRLTYHSVGESLALAIARRLGFPPAVLRFAEAARSEQAKTLAAAMESLEQSRRRFEERQEALAARAQASALKEQEIERLLQELQDKRRRRWADELAAARHFVREVREQGRELLAALERGSADRRALRQFVEQHEAAIAAHERTTAVAAPPPLPGPPEIGDQVEVGERGLRGQLLSLTGDRAWIQRGGMRFEVPAAQLRRLAAAPQVSVEVHLPGAAEDAPHEITLLGLRAKEALAQLEQFLDDTMRTDHASVRIIHGVGSGALQRAVAEYLARSPYCASFRVGEAREGGAGVTIAELRRG